MTEKKTLTEEQLIKLSEEQLKKISGGYATGDTCPSCKKGMLTYDRNYGGYSCTQCPFITYDPNSGR